MNTELITELIVKILEEHQFNEITDSIHDPEREYGYWCDCRCGAELNNISEWRTHVAAWLIAGASVY